MRASTRGERGARTHVGTEAEREVRVPCLAVHTERVGVHEHVFVTIRRAEAHHDPFRGVDRAAVHRPLRDAPAATNRIGGVMRRLSSIAVSRAREVGAHRRLEARNGAQLVHEVPEQLTRRGQPTGDEVPHQRAQLAAGEWLAVDRECEQLGEHVIGRLAGGELGGAVVRRASM